jgi:hypothetical protein
MMNRKTLPILLATAFLAVGVSACSLVSNDGSGGELDGVGRIPGNDFVGVATLPPSLASDVKFPKLEGAVLGSVAQGNKLLMIGDSIMASISKRYGNEACGLMVPQGWNVALEAEAGQFAEFAGKVLDLRWSEGWDAVVIGLGSNYDGNKDRYRTAMEKAIARISPLPILLVNTTEFRSKQAEVNAIIEELVAANENITLLDWRTISATRSLRSNDGIHPSPDGRVVLATAIARAVGIAPSAPGDCMKVNFQDDSRVLQGVMPTTTTQGAGASTTLASNSTTSPVPVVTTSPAVATTVATVPATTVPVATTATTAATAPTAAPATTIPTPSSAAPAG